MLRYCWSGAFFCKWALQEGSCHAMPSMFPSAKARTQVCYFRLDELFHVKMKLYTAARVFVPRRIDLPAFLFKFEPVPFRDCRVKIARLMVQSIKARLFVQFLACKTAERIRGRHCIPQTIEFHLSRWFGCANRETERSCSLLQYLKPSWHKAWPVMEKARMMNRCRMFVRPAGAVELWVWQGCGKGCWPLAAADGLWITTCWQALDMRTTWVDRELDNCYICPWSQTKLKNDHCKIQRTIFFLPSSQVAWIVCLISRPSHMLDYRNISGNVIKPSEFWNLLKMLRIIRIFYCCGSHLQSRAAALALAKMKTCVAKEVCHASPTDRWTHHSAVQNSH